MPRLLLDNDFAAKLAVADLLDWFLEDLEIDHQDCALLAQFKPQVAKGKSRFGKKYKEHRETLLGLHSRCCVIGEVGVEHLEPFTDVVDIDPGEVILFGALLESTSLQLATADIRALKALTTLDVRSKLYGRIVSVEAVLITLYYSRGQEAIRAQIKPEDDPKVMSLGSTRDPEGTLRYLWDTLCGSIDEKLLWVPPTLPPELPKPDPE